VTTKNKRTILVVDDERDLVDLISYNLTRHGFGVLTALDGNDALDVATKELPDLICLDLMMPGIDGTRSRGGSSPTRARARSPSSCSPPRARRPTSSSA
jgi:PleD family two-component response regulator